MTKPSKPILPKKSNLEPKVKESKATPPVLTDEALVEKAFKDIQAIYIKNTQQTYTEIAEYLFETFFNEDIELLRKKTPVPEKAQSFNMLCQKLKDAGAGLPKKSWLYNALGLLTDLDDLVNTDAFQTYGNLSVSHKVQLLPIHDLEQKKELIIEIKKENYSVRDLQKRVQELRPKRKKRAINTSKQLEKLHSTVEDGKMIAQNLFNSFPENKDYKILYKQFMELIDLVNKFSSQQG